MLARNRTTRLSYLRNMKMNNYQKSPKDFNINNPECNSGYKRKIIVNPEGVESV
jgi:hypothetical protein